MNDERRAVVRDAAFTALRPDEFLFDTIADAIADAIEVALAWQPSEGFATALADGLARGREYRQVAESAPTSGGLVSRWGCGCDATECILRRDQMQDASPDPTAIVSITCMTHGLVGRSHPGRVAEGLSRRDAQAMLKLDQAHQEQCR